MFERKGSDNESDKNGINTHSLGVEPGREADFIVKKLPERRTCIWALR